MYTLFLSPDVLAGEIAACIPGLFFQIWESSLLFSLYSITSAEETESYLNALEAVCNFC